MRTKNKTIKSLKHLKWVSKQNCISCGSHLVQVAHIRHLPSGNIGMSRKSDQYVVPLCFGCHSLQHKMNEQIFWKNRGINPMEIAKELCLKSPCKKVKDFNESTDYFKEGI